MKRIFLLAIIVFLFSGCEKKPDDIFKVNNTTIKIDHRYGLDYVYSESEYGWKREMIYKNDLNITKDDIEKIMKRKY
jgi:hypothetical protein